MKRIAVGGFQLEANTYQSPVCLDTVESVPPDRLVEAFAGGGRVLGGVLGALEAAGAEPVPLGFHEATVLAPWRRSVWRDVRGRLLSALEDALPVDAVVLDLHGAGLDEDHRALEPGFAAAVRARVGAAVPVVACFDLHGYHFDDELLSSLDGVIPCHEYPHTDDAERGAEAVDRVMAMLAGAPRPVIHAERLPMLVPSLSTLGGAGREINEVCASLRRRAGVEDCTFAHGFVQADHVDVGAYAIVHAVDGQRAVETAYDLAQAVWQRRGELASPMHSPEQATLIAKAHAGGLLVVADYADNPGAGTLADSTILLQALLEAGVEDSAFGILCDPQAAAAAHAAGRGAELDVTLGSDFRDLDGTARPLAVSAQVLRLSDGRFRYKGPMEAGWQVDAGPSALLAVGGIRIVVGSRPVQVLDDAPFEMHGVDVSRLRVLAIKSEVHFRAFFEPLAARIITVESPCLGTGDLSRYPRTLTGRPIWPLDDL